MTDETSPQTDERRRHGRRLEELVRDRWTDPRGIRGLSQDLGVSRATLYSWFNGATSPDTGSLTRLARLLLVSPAELLAALEGSDQTAQLDERIRAVAHQTLREYVTPVTDQQVRMTARAPDSWRLAPAAPSMPAMRGESTARPTSAPRAAGRSRWMLPSDVSRSLSRRARAASLLDAIGPQTVEWCDADEPVGPVAVRLYRGNFSQLPVRDRDAWVGLLTTDTIARWTAARSGRGASYDEATPVREVLAYAEDPDNFRVVPADALVENVLRTFDESATQGRSLAAVLVTPTGEPRGEMVGIVTAADVAQLRR